MVIPRLLSQLAAVSCIRAMSLAAAAREAKVTEGRFTTNDGTVLDYLEAGSGQLLVMVPGSRTFPGSAPLRQAGCALLLAGAPCRRGR
jgi:hypothetical protein